MTAESFPFFFTWSQQVGAEALALAGAEGVWFETTDGARWLDLGSFSYQANLGHGHPRVIEAIQRQAAALCTTMPHAVFPAKRELAERLLALAPPGFTKVFFTLGGAEANENAIKLARMVTGRHKLVSRYRSYHGASMGALTLTGDWRRVGLEPGLPGVVRALDCYCDRCPFGKTLPTCDRECARHIGDVLDLEGAGTVGAVFLEPVVGANGVLIPPPEYWPIVREACDRHGALLVADEVLTGFGRTGRCFAIEHFGVVPDLITCAKGLTGGYAPMGAVLVHERVAEHFDERVLRAGLTAYAHPIGCAAALAALDVYRDEDLFSRAAALEPALLGRFRAMAASIPAIRAVRGIGLLAAMEIDARPGFWPALAAALERHRLFVHTYPARDTLIVSPPLTIDEDTLAGGLDALSAALSEAVDHAHASRGETSP